MNRIGDDFPEQFSFKLDDNAREQMARAALLLGMRPSKYITQLLCGVTTLLNAVYQHQGKAAFEECAANLFMVKSTKTPAAGDQAGEEKGGDHV